MALEKISELLVEATGFGINDSRLLMSKELSPANWESQWINPNNLFYDSGFKQFPLWNGSYGMADLSTYGLSIHPYIRIVNRTVMVNGIYILPLSTTPDGLTLAPDYTAYDWTHNDKPWIYKGADGGFAISTNGATTTVNPILPTALRPEGTAYLSAVGHIGVRPIKNLNGAGNKRYPLQSFIYQTYMTTGGNFGVTPAKSIEGNGNASYSITSELRHLCTKLTAGDELPDFAGWGSGFTAGVSNRNVTPSTYLSPITIDAAEGAQLGGFYIRFNGVYNISKATSMDSIIAAFDAL